MWVLQGGAYEQGCLLLCDAVWSGRHTQTFHRNEAHCQSSKWGRGEGHVALSHRTRTHSAFTNNTVTFIDTAYPQVSPLLHCARAGMLVTTSVLSSNRAPIGKESIRCNSIPYKCWRAQGAGDVPSIFQCTARIFCVLGVITIKYTSHNYKLCKPAHDFVTMIPTNMKNGYQACFNNTAKAAPYKVMFLITQNF